MIERAAGERELASSFGASRAAVHEVLFEALQLAYQSTD
jgi:DNA-binding FadR family transcriptional regulator